RSLVRTTVVQHLHAVVGMSHHQNRLCPDRGAEVIPRFCHLAVMADIDPGVCEQVLHFEREDFIVDIDVAMNLRLPNQTSDSLGISAVSGQRHLVRTSQRSSTSSGPIRSLRPCARRPAPYGPWGWLRNSSGAASAGWTWAEARPPGGPSSRRSFPAISAILTT